ncbi:hypothetical protein PF002_g11579 [Phytophthora fragariae]|nr:hypothetical protein PF011_g9819 [Phytophthora fragariae]KAE9235290.1 hypothetical protein PF002_g11579 [Phytophthora fragariae]
MKVVLEDQLERHPSLTPLQLLSTLSYKIANTELRGPEPSYNQVEYFLRVWRDNHPGADTHQVSSAIDPSLYDEVGIHERSPRAVVYFSEAVRDEGRWVSRVGVGTEDDPYRIGLTCYQLLYDYVQVQTNPDVAVIVHIDSTFNTVKQKYPAFVIGYSDRCGQFFPLGYFCTSKRKNADVGWCLRHLQRAILDTFHVHFQPEFVMTDADKAQYKASRNELPSSRVLMCWYHVTANVYKQARSRSVSLEETDKFFEDLYDLHYVPEDEFEDLKTKILARWAALPAGSAAFKMGCYVKKSWIDGKFCDWQAFLTSKGCVATNNPLEQYHKTYKIVSNKPKAIPLQMLEGMNASLQAFIATNRGFQTAVEASARLLKAYALLKPHHCLLPVRLPSMGELRTLLYRVDHLPLPPIEQATRDKLKRVASSNHIRRRASRQAFVFLVPHQCGVHSCLTLLAFDVVLAVPAHAHRMADDTGDAQGQDQADNAELTPNSGNQDPAVTSPPSTLSPFRSIGTGTLLEAMDASTTSESGDNGIAASGNSGGLVAGNNDGEDGGPRQAVTHEPRAIGSSVSLVPQPVRRSSRQRRQTQRARESSAQSKRHRR